MFYYGFLIFGLNGHEAKQTLEGSEGQGSLECCSPWGHELATEQHHQSLAYVPIVLLGFFLMIV